MKSKAQQTYIGSIMTRNVETVPSETNLVEACKKLDRNGINSLVVTDEQNRIKGILTSSDIVSVVSNGVPFENSVVDDAMTSDAITLQTTDLVSHAVEELLENNIHHIPVTDADNTVTGIISTSDVSAYMQVY